MTKNKKTKALKHHPGHDGSDIRKIHDQQCSASKKKIKQRKKHKSICYPLDCNERNDMQKPLHNLDQTEIVKTQFTYKQSNKHETHKVDKRKNFGNKTMQLSVIDGKKSKSGVSSVPVLKSPLKVEASMGRNMKLETGPDRTCQVHNKRKIRHKKISDTMSNPVIKSRFCEDKNQNTETSYIKHSLLLQQVKSIDKHKKVKTAGKVGDQYSKNRIAVKVDLKKVHQLRKLEQIPTASKLPENSSQMKIDKHLYSGSDTSLNDTGSATNERRFDMRCYMVNCSSEKVNKALKQKLNSLGFKIQTGCFSKAEDNQLLKNVDSFCKDHNVSPFDLLGTVDRENRSAMLKLKRKKNFYCHITTGLSRTPKQCFNHLSSAMLYKLQKKGTHSKWQAYSCVDDKLLKQLYRQFGDKWTKIAYIMGRAMNSVFDRWSILKRPSWYHAGKWSSKESNQLIKSIKKNTGVSNVSNVFHNIPWKTVASEIPTRTDKQCRSHWLEIAGNIYKPTQHRRFSSRDRKQLITLLYHANMPTEAEIDWDKLLEHFENAPSPQILKKMWYRMKTTVSNFQEKSFSEIVEQLFEKYQLSIYVHSDTD